MRPFLTLALLLVPAFTWAQSNDGVIVPGKRVGAITASTTRADLEKMFPGMRLKDGRFGKKNDIHVTSVPGLSVQWTDAKKTRIASVTVLNDKWATESGLRVGMPLAELVKLNGNPIAFDGSWMYGGMDVVDWNGGKLQGLPGMKVTLTTGDGVDLDESTQAEYDEIKKSEDPEAAKLKIRVSSLSVQLR